MMQNHPVTINGIKYGRLSNAMAALGIPEKEWDNLHYALSIDTPYSFGGVTIYLRGGELVSKRSRLRRFRDDLPALRERYEERQLRKRPLLRTVCTSYLGVDRGEHWI